jgi:hypothetical protein
VIHRDRIHPAAWGIALGLGFSLLGGTILLDILGFWMGGLLVLPVTGLLGLGYATWRQRAPRTILWWTAGVLIGLVPVAAFLARRTANFWLEFLLPLVTGLLLALTVGPLYIRWTRTRTREPSPDAQAT